MESVVGPDGAQTHVNTHTYAYTHAHSAHAVKPNNLQQSPSRPKDEI